MSAFDVLAVSAVALRKESVDRNIGRFSKCYFVILVALRKESVDRNSTGLASITVLTMSLSARRAWIEISRYLVGFNP